MKQQYNKYTPEDQEVWNILFERQIKNLQGKCDVNYLRCLESFAPVLNAEHIPDFEKVNEFMSSRNGWEIHVVPGLIPVEEFFSLLAEKKWCSSTWLRTKAQLDYLEEPDMFHDIFGHLPLLLDDVFASFMERFGKIGANHLNEPIVLTALQRLYWFTVEFGLSAVEGQEQIYGAGIISSFGETNHVFENQIMKHPFDLEQVINHAFVNNEIQMEYYVIQEFSDLYNAVERLEALISEGLDITPAIVR
ncbi:phenylalanine 4-monooxygenase [Sanyastnella coralliicola]|uniref:phenylalanine 4-monooxygenase n=1 Tax=Sanyastnella coralliicola TaxID=3069118 RepID=UPI0027BACF75|nr:phenylalanine 4-monooxygenase [Longitalea sp. SCSIO 12813]